MKYTDALIIIRFFGHDFQTRTIMIKIPKVILIIILTLFATGCTTGMSSLHKAAYNGDIKATTTELDKGADVNEIFLSEWTPLRSAAQYGYFDIAKLLLDRGADVNLRPGGGLPALVNAINECRLDIIKLFLERGAKVEPLYIKYAKEKDCDVAVILLTEAQLKQLNKKPGDKPKTTKKEAADML